MRKTTNIVIVLTALVFALSVAGCRSHKETVTQELPPANCPYRWLTATADCEVMGTNVNALLRTQCDSVIWATASKIIELGRVRMTRDSVVVYASIYNRYFAGSYEDVYRLTGVRTTFDEIQNKISDAYAQGRKEMAVKLNAKQLNQTIKLNIHRMEAVSHPLTYPLRIPASAQRMK
ncbi:MAG: DUF4292 domain-containing protein [Bacteroidales bacterium]|nr:DUF4292 domain-containing protein [Bacteroidales bacterium]